MSTCETTVTWLAVSLFFGLPWIVGMLWIFAAWLDWTKKKP